MLITFVQVKVNGLGKNTICYVMIEKYMKRYFPPVKVSDSWLAWMFRNPLEVRLCPASVACSWSGWLLSLKNSKSGTDRTQVLCYHTPIKMSLIWGI